MIQLPLITPNGPIANVHVVKRTEAAHPMDNILVHVQSFSDEATYVAGAGPLWSSPVQIPVSELSLPLPLSIENWLCTNPDSPFLGGTVVVDTSGTLAGKQQRKLAAMSAQCKNTINEGFTSSALGEAHLYPAKTVDQANLVASVTDSLMPGLPEDWVTPFWCAVGDEWSYCPHTAAQIQQVGRDGKAAIIAAMLKNEQLAQMIAAATLETIDQVTWDSI